MIEKQDLRIVFMGTPDFAVASLDILVREGYQIVGVITAPDKPAGRGLQLQESAVKKYAVAKGLKILQPEKLKNEADARLANAQAELAVAQAQADKITTKSRIIYKTVPTKGTATCEGDRQSTLDLLNTANQTGVLDLMNGVTK